MLELRSQHGFPSHANLHLMRTSTASRSVAALQSEEDECRVRRGITGLLVLGSATALLVGCANGNLRPPGPPSATVSAVTGELADLYAAAKEEGKVVVYENASPDAVAAVKQGFEQKFPGIVVDAVRLPVRWRSSPGWRRSWPLARRPPTSSRMPHLAGFSRKGRYRPHRYRQELQQLSHGELRRPPAP